MALQGPVRVTEFTSIATYLQQKSTKSALPFPDIAAVKECLVALLSVGGIVEFSRSPNGSSRSAQSSTHGGSEPPCEEENSFVNEIAVEMFLAIQQLSEQTNQDGLSALGSCCKRAHSFAKQCIRRKPRSLVERHSSSKNLMLSEDTIAVSYVLILLIVWLHVMYGPCNEELWNDVCNTVKSNGILKKLQDQGGIKCMKRIQIVQSHLEVLTAAILHGKVDTFTYLYRALACFYRNEIVSLTKGGKASNVMSMILEYGSDLSKFSRPPAIVQRPPKRARISGPTEFESLSCDTPKVTEEEVNGWVALLFPEE